MEETGVLEKANLSGPCYPALNQVSDFTTVELQASVFTAGINFRTAKALPVLLQAWPQRFTNVVHASDLPPNAPPEIPHVIIQSGDARYKAQAGPARLDLFWLRQALRNLSFSRALNMVQ